MKHNRVEQRKRDLVADATVIVNVRQPAGRWLRAKGAKVSEKNMTEEGLKERMDGLPERGESSARK